MSQSHDPAAVTQAIDGVVQQLQAARDTLRHIPGATPERSDRMTNASMRIGAAVAELWAAK